MKFMNGMNNKIDFVVTWVDSNDSDWIEEKNKYIPKANMSNSKNRYKDWGMFKYWFRGVEKFAPWVNKVYLITYGHLPKWLNVKNPKLVILNHKDYIPKEYLPTFNSNTIELNLHRIKELSENFVLFNDDTILINKTKEEDFFKNNIPCCSAALNVHCPIKSQIIQNISNNNVGIINEHFEYKKTFNKNKKIWFNIKNGRMLLRTIALCKCPRYPGFWMDHLPTSHKKSVFKEVWDCENEILSETSSHKFRSAKDVNHWLMKEWQIVNGRIKNRSIKRFGKSFYIIENNMDYLEKEILKYITHQKGKIICINDSDLTGERYEMFVPKIMESFEKIMPEKSSYEI